MTDDDVLSLDAAAIMALTKPEQLFDKNTKPGERDFKSRVRKLLSKWHRAAETAPELGEVFAHIRDLESCGLSKLETNNWAMPPMVKFETPNSSISILYLQSQAIPGWGTRYEGIKGTYHIVPAAHESLIDNWWQNSVGNKLSPSKLVKSDFLNGFRHQFNCTPVSRKSEDGKNYLIVVNRGEDFINLADIQAKLKQIPIEHVTWIMSRLYNLACLMQVQDVLNLNICPQSIYVFPKDHAVVLVDGWQYGFSFQSKISFAPAATLAMFPELKTTKQPTMHMVLSMIKSTALRLLGDPLGTSLKKRGDVPDEIIHWLMTPSGDNAIKEYASYVKFRDEAFHRKFINWDITSEDIYPEV